MSADHAWKLEDAKARFSEVVRLARSQGPQSVLVRGKPTVVLISVQEFDRLRPPAGRPPLVSFLEWLAAEGLDLDRAPDLGRHLRAVKGWLLDTHVIAALANPNGAPSVKRLAQGQAGSRMRQSVVTFGEYDKGIHNLAIGDPTRSCYEAARDALEARFAGRILSVSDAVARRWGAISGAVKLPTGHAPSIVDTRLAATALEHGLLLVTRNTKDVQFSGAAMFNPWIDDPATFR